MFVGGLLHHGRTHLGRSRERDLRDARVGDQRARRRRAGPREHAEGPLGKPRLVQDVGDRERRERRLRRGLDDRGVPAGEGRCDLPRRDHGGEVPRGDQGADAHRLAERDVDPRRHDRDRLAEDLVGRTAPVLEDVRDDVDLGTGRRDRLAPVAGLETRELLLAVADQERRLRQAGARVRARSCGARRRPRRRARRRRPRGARPRDSPSPPRPSARRSPARSPRTVAPSAAATRSPPSTISSRHRVALPSALPDAAHRRPSAYGFAGSRPDEEARCVSTARSP